ncbi:SWPV1-120 [Shearwaterpox virus]|uniref:SWPV1-120 n=1 Tax=Shearwaterpox virus TaxID=1974596 RepID=A0A1V0S7W4_CNPV|nr:SWPV1-120 [Shearwaterpox virus]
MYKYQPLKDNDYEEEEILIPGLEEDDERTFYNERINNKHDNMSFEKQVLEIVRNNHINNYKDLIPVLNMHNDTTNLTELLYEIISSNPSNKYKFNINNFDNIFGLYNRLHEFIHVKKVKISYGKNFLNLSFSKDNIFLKIDVLDDVEGKLMDVNYKIEFKDVIKLKISNSDIIISGDLICIKNKIFILSKDYKIVSNENDFLLEIENIKKLI